MLPKCLSFAIFFAVFHSAASIQRHQTRPSFEVKVTKCETCMIGEGCASLKAERDEAVADDGHESCYETCKAKEGEEFDDWIDLGCPSEDGESPCDMCVNKLNGDGDINAATCKDLSIEKDSTDGSTCYHTCLAEDGDAFLSFMTNTCDVLLQEEVTIEDGTTDCDNTTGTCTLMEDPHITVFDQAQISLLDGRSNSVADAFGNESIGDNIGDNVGDTIGDKWLVKTSRVSIQGRFLPGTENPERAVFLKAIAIGGSFLGGGVLVVGPLEDNITFNGNPILESQTSNFRADGDDYSVKAERTVDASLVGNLSQQNPGVVLNLPLNINLIINRLKDHVNVAITMSKQSGGQDGLCGNFNGLGTDDSLEFTSSRLNLTVPEEETLFANTIVM